MLAQQHTQPACGRRPLMWARVPRVRRQLTHFFNVPLDTAPESALNPLRVILSVATPDDFVVVKARMLLPHSLRPPLPAHRHCCAPSVQSLLRECLPARAPAA